MTENIWDDPDLQSTDFYKFDTVGDVVTGVIVSVSTHTFDDGKKVPQLLLRDSVTGEDKTLTAGQTRLKMELVEKKPRVGDHVRVTYAKSEPRAGGKTLKHFEVVITPAGGVPAAAPAPAAGVDWAAAQAAQVAPAAAPAVDPVAAQAALAQLSPEQRAALGL